MPSVARKLSLVVENLINLNSKQVCTTKQFDVDFALKALSGHCETKDQDIFYRFRSKDREAAVLGSRVAGDIGPKLMVMGIKNPLHHRRFVCIFSNCRFD